MDSRNKDKDQYIKFLSTIDIIQKHSDETHPLSVSEIQEKLYEKDYDFSINHRAIKKYVKFYNDYFEDDIIQIEKKGRNLYFSYTNPYLDPIEAKAIIDLVYSSDFFTKQTKENYIKRMEDLFSIHHENYFKKKLDLHIHKNENPQVFYQELETIIKAIQTNKKIRFNYKKPNPDKSINTKEHEASPIDTIFSNNEYYLVCQSNKNPKDFILCRLDYVKNVIIIEDSSVFFTLEDINSFNEKLKQMTYMYGEGKIETIELSFKDNIYTNIIDKFGKDIKPEKLDEDTYKVKVRHIINSTFYSWIIGFGGYIQIIGNKEQVDRFNNFLITNFLK